MALPAFNMRELIEAGVHFGHKTKRWNPRMAPYIFGVRNDIHIIDLGKTVPMLQQALTAVRDVVSGNGRILFVGTKRQASDPIAEAAKRCGQHYINQRWLGGLLTNWTTIQASIKRLRKLEENLSTPNIGFTKKELLSMTRERDKLEASLGGIKDMGGRPDLLFIIDTGKEDLAVKEANKLGIPIVAIIDSNCSVEGITYPIPGNDDSSRAIRLYCRLISDAVLDGLQQSMVKSGADMGARENGAEIIAVSNMMTEAGEAKSEDGEDDGKKKSAGRGRGGNHKPAAKKAPVVTVKKAPGKVAKKEE
ncbi:MAG: 30S ribosomal protein S2 [Alphaproteobacteria bacterium]|nr:30S ribosomal protein S2 [Alphaproteobacteria bacterium]